MTDLLHLSGTNEPRLALQHLLISCYPSFDKVIVNKFPLIFKLTNHLRRDISMSALLTFQKLQCRAYRVDDPFYLCLHECKLRRHICQSTLKGLVFYNYLLVVLAEDVGGLVFRIYEFLYCAEILILKIGSLSYYLTKALELLCTDLQRESKTAVRLGHYALSRIQVCTHSKIRIQNYNNTHEQISDKVKIILKFMLGLLDCTRQIPLNCSFISLQQRSFFTLIRMFYLDLNSILNPSFFLFIFQTKFSIILFLLIIIHLPTCALAYLLDTLVYKTDILYH